jgi:hypothetical protein
MISDGLEKLCGIDYNSKYDINTHIKKELFSISFLPDNLKPRKTLSPVTYI